MSRVARILANELLDRLAPKAIITDNLVHRIIKDENVEIVRYPFTGKVQEYYCDGFIVLRKDLSRELERWYILHSLAHHFLHVGDHRFLSRAFPWLMARQERQADAFAGYMLFSGLPRAVFWTPEKLAYDRQVPLERVRYWWKIVSESATGIGG